MGAAQRRQEICPQTSGFPPNLSWFAKWSIGMAHLRGLPEVLVSSLVLGLWGSCIPEDEQKQSRVRDPDMWKLGSSSAWPTAGIQQMVTIFKVIIIHDIGLLEESSFTFVLFTYIEILCTTAFGKQ